MRTSHIMRNRSHCWRLGTIDVAMGHQRQRRSRAFLMTVASLMLLLTMFPFSAREASADGGGWTMSIDGGGTLEEGKQFSLFNEENEKYIVYGSRTWGINIVWTKDAPNNFVARRGGQSPATGPIVFSETVALMETSKNDERFLYYTRRDYGINLRWWNEPPDESSPIFEWQLRDPFADEVGQPIEHGDEVILFNLTKKTPNTAPFCGRPGSAVVYGQRPVGVNLVWSPPGHYDGSIAVRVIVGGPTWDEVGELATTLSDPVIDEAANYISGQTGIPPETARGYIDDVLSRGGSC